MNKFYIEKIISVNHWNKDIVSFKCSRNSYLKFLNGEFILIGLLINNNIIYKAYSILSSNYDNFLEILSIKLKLGILTKNFFDIKKNFKLLISKKNSGTLNFKNLNKSKNLWLLGTGTGISPLISILKDEKIFLFYKKIFLIYSEKIKLNLIYEFFFKKKLYFSLKKKMNKIFFLFIVTREYYNNNIKLNDLIIYEYIFNKINKNKFTNLDKFIICCNNENIKNISYILVNLYNLKYNGSKKNDFIFEKSFLNL